MPRKICLLFLVISLLLSTLFALNEVNSQQSKRASTEALHLAMSKLNDRGYVKQVSPNGEEIKKLENFFPSPHQYFSTVLAVNNNSVVIGSPTVNFNISEKFERIVFDAVHIMDITNGYLSCPPFLHPASDTATGFGTSVDIIKGMIAIGAPGDDIGATDAGVVYLFNTSTGALLRTLVSPAPDSGDGFGRSVAIHNNRVLVGVPFDDSGAIDAGAAYLFNTNTGQLIRTFTNPTPEASDQFGWALDMTDTEIIIGTPADDATGRNSGAVYVYDFASGNLKRTYVNPNTNDPAYDSFGFSLNIAGMNLIVGAPNASRNSPNAGAAYLFSLNSSSTTPIFSFENPDPDLLDLFGWSVAGDDEHIVVGAPYGENGNRVAGAAYLFDARTGQFLKTLIQSQSRDLDGFGFSSAVVNDRVLVGAPNNSQTGAVWNFPAVSTNTAAQIAIPVVSAMPGEIIEVPIKVSSNSALSLLQFTVEFKRNVLAFVSASPGTEASGCQIITQPNLPFAPVSPVSDENVLLQISCGSGSIIGDEQEVARLTFRVIGQIHARSPLEIDSTVDHTFLTTSTGRDLRGDDLEFVNGVVKVEKVFAVTGNVGYADTERPVSGVSVGLYHPNHYFRTARTDSAGEFAFEQLLPRRVRLTSISKSGDARGAITGADALKVLRALAFLETLTEYQKKAADVDGDGTVTGTDAVAIQNYLAFIRGLLSRNTGRWIATLTDTTFDLNSNTRVPFRSILLGDVNLNWGMNGSSSSQLLAVAYGSHTVHNSSSSAKITLPELQATSCIPVPILISTDSLISVAQMVVEYDSTMVAFDGAELGADAKNFSVIVNSDNLPFQTTTNGTNKNVLIQISSGSQTFSGTDQEIIVLNMHCIKTGQSPLNIDQVSEHTFLTTQNGTDLNGAALEFGDGRVNISSCDACVTSVEGNLEDESIPDEYRLLQNYPNPFNPTTTIAFSVPKLSQVSLKVYDLLGREVANLVDSELQAGVHEVIFDAGDLPSGVYIYRLQIGNFDKMRKLLLMK